MSKISSLLPSTTKPKRRVGRGIGSTKGGHTSGRGTKGQWARQGALVPLWFEGGQLPLVKRLPMLRGKGRLKPTTQIIAVTLSDIEKIAADVVTVESLKLEKVIPAKATKVKIIATGVITKSKTIKGLSVTESAKKQIETVGGTVEN